MQIQEYKIREKLYAGRKFAVYRAHKIGSTESYILKVLEKQALLNVKTLQGLQHEYALLQQIHSEYVVRALDWIEDRESAGLVLEDIEGRPLKEEFNKTPLPASRFLTLALQISNGLAAIHQCNIIHQDINPYNIIWDPRTGRLQLIDFDIATQYALKIAHAGNPEHLTGTLPYISPEQSGRTNRRVDQRTDFYSLGVTFYEMLTGRLPFEYQDPMELVYAHLAKMPVPPYELHPPTPLKGGVLTPYPSQEGNSPLEGGQGGGVQGGQGSVVPKILSDIIMKLLAKDPEDRYQSAEGLKYDLEQVQTTLTGDETLSGFTPGTQDFSGKLRIPEKLYGREREIEQLLQTYQRVSHGGKELLFVTGYSGAGKTALVNAIQPGITRDRGYFISGKFDQLQRTIPYFAFIQAFNHFCQLLLTERREVLAQWKTRILKAVGTLGSVLTGLIPLMEPVIGKQPEAPEVGGEEARKRFMYVLQRFLRAIATREHPLVIFLDDLQWADLASLNLLQALLENTQTGHVFFIGAYRNNEVSSSHPLTMTLEVLRKQQTAMSVIAVHNLTLPDVREWLGDTLGTSSASGQEIALLADLFYQKTRGNAFFTVQLLRNLYEEGLLEFDFAQSRWTWNMTEIARQEFSDNVVELLTRKIRTLPDEIRESLTLAACIGNSFDLPTFAVISPQRSEDSAQHFEKALMEQLLIPIEDEEYQFAHDRIHQAAYALIPEIEKKPLHLKIGRLLLKSGETRVQLFDIVNHLDLGSELLEDGQERLELLQLNLQAAQQARRSGASTLGENYVQQARHLLPDDCWQRQYKLSLAVYNEAIQSAFLCGNFEQMEQFVETVLQQVTTIQDRVVAYEYRMMSFSVQNQPQRAEEILLQTFETLGISLPKTLNPESLFTHYSAEQIKQLPLMRDPDTQLILRLAATGIAALLHASPDLLPFVVEKMVALTLQHGLAPETPLVLSLYGTIRNLMGDTVEAYYVGKLALDLIDSIPGSELMKPKVVVNAGFYLLGWQEHYKDVGERLRANYHDAMNVGDLEWAGYSLGMAPLCLSRTDMELPVLKEIFLQTRETLIPLKQPVALFGPDVETPVVANLLGETSHPGYLELDLTSFPQDLPVGPASLISYALNIKKILLAYLFDDYTHILEYIRKAEDAWKVITTPLIFYKSDFHFYRPLAYIQLAARADSQAEREEYLNQVSESLKLLKDWADVGPVNFLHKYYLLHAEFDRVSGNAAQTGEYYDKAIEAAYQNEYIHEAGIANELAAKFYLNQQRGPLAEFYLQRAYQCYQKWGATAKVKHLEEHYPKYLRPSAERTGTTSTETTGQLDVNTLLKASQTLSGEVQLSKLFEKMLHILIENAGAQRGVYLDVRGARVLVQAEGTADGVTGLLQAVPVEEAGNVPLTVINYVARSKQPLVFDHLAKETTYTHDPYIQQQQPVSAVCFPVLKQGELAAILYLENHLVEGAFTPARLEILNLLSAQIAISVENAELYENLEEKVRQRTAELRQAHADLEHTHEALAESHKAITDSVDYASRIQDAVLPAEELLVKLLPEHFILFQPRSVVSGDFYWVRQVEDRLIVAVADCTGHGVPGALVSMLGMAFLNELVPQLAARGRLQAGILLDELREKVKTAFKQEGRLMERKDGMDIALCIFEPDKERLQFAGAYNPLYLIRNGVLHEIKADHMPIGIHRREKPFRTQEVELHTGDLLYLFSDGYADQDGGSHRLGFSKARFQDLLLEIHQEPFDRQKSLLLQRFTAWKGNFPQRDDVLVFGLRV